MGPKSLEVLNMGHIGQQPKIFFENMPNLKQLRINIMMTSWDKFDSISLEKLTWLEDLTIVVAPFIHEQEIIHILENFSKLKKLTIRGLSKVERDFLKIYRSINPGCRIFY